MYDEYKNLKEDNKKIVGKQYNQYYLKIEKNNNNLCDNNIGLKYFIYL